MAQYDLPISVTGGFSALSDAMAHRRVIGRLQSAMETAQSVASDLREVDKADIGVTGSDLYKDLAPGLGHSLMLSQPEGGPLLGAELTYQPDTGDVRQLTVDLGSSKLAQVGRTFKIEENGVTTYFQKDEQRNVFTVMDKDHDVPALFGDADPTRLIHGTLQLGKPILIF